MGRAWPGEASAANPRGRKGLGESGKCVGAECSDSHPLLVATTRYIEQSLESTQAARAAPNPLSHAPHRACWGENNPGTGPQFPLIPSSFKGSAPVCAFTHVHDILQGEAAALWDSVFPSVKWSSVFGTGLWVEQWS